MQTKKRPVIGIFGTNGSLSRTLSPVANSLALAGNNTGNLIYQYAADRNIIDPKLFFSQVEENDLEMIKASIDVLHIPAANQLNPNFDLGGWADIVNYLDKPVFIAGLGLQCELSEGEVVLTDGTVRLIEALRKYAPFIGVRGAATKALLHRYGIDNVVITGCPSNFINRRINGASIDTAIARARANPAPRVDFFPSTMSNHRDVESKLRSMVNTFDHRYVLQTNPLLFSTVDGQTSPKTAEYLAWERGILEPTVSQEDYNYRYAKHGAFYFSAAAWIDSISQRDLGIGMRMHGVVATIQGGGAGVCVVSDGRIRELVDTMAYPWVSLEDIAASASLHDVLDKVNFSAQSYDAQRSSSFGIYRKAAIACGVALNEEWYRDPV